MKRIISAVTCTAMLISVMSVFSGCSLQEFFAKDDQNSTVATNTADDGTLTNGDWLSMVNDAFGMPVDESDENGDLAAAEEWGVIDSKDNIDKNAPVSDEFVTKTLMKASGFVSPDATDEEIIQSAVDHGIITKDADLTNVQNAAQSLDTAKDAWSHQTFENKMDITYADGVQDLTGKEDLKDVNVRESDNTVIMPTDYAKNLTADSVYILPPNSTYKKGCAFKAVSVTDNGDGTSTVKNVPAKIEEIYSDMDVSGGFDADCGDIEILNDNVKIEQTPAEGMSQSYDSTDPQAAPMSCVPGDAQIDQMGSKSFNSISLALDIDDVKYSIGIKNIKLNTDVDWSWSLFSGLDVDRVYMALDYTTTVGVKYGWKPDQEKFEEALKKINPVLKPKMELAKIPVYICPGISVNFRVDLVFKISGGVEVVITQDNTRGFEIKGSNVRSINEDTCTSDIKISAEAGLYLDFVLALSLDYVVGEKDLLSLTLEIGPTLKGTMDIHDTGLVCISISGYIKLDIKLELNAIFAKTSVTLTGWDSSSSPWKFNIHLENFVPVPKCTYSSQTTSETTVTTQKIPEGSFVLGKTYISMNKGAQTAASLKSMPSGCDASSLKWSSDKPDVVKVDNSGNITAVAPGSATITVQTADGKYKASCAVVVHQDFSNSAVRRNIPANYDTYTYAA